LKKTTRNDLSSYFTHLNSYEEWSTKRVREALQVNFPLIFFNLNLFIRRSSSSKKSLMFCIFSRMLGSSCFDLLIMFFGELSYRIFELIFDAVDGKYSHRPAIN